MTFIRHRLRSCTWLALFAVLALALAPTVSHALAARSHGAGFNPWAEVCTAAGKATNGVAARLAEGAWPAVAGVDGAKPADATPAPSGDVADDASSPAAGVVHHLQHHLDHCPLCGAAAHAPALPSASLAPLLHVDGARHVPALFERATRPLFAWSACRPRGPPSVS